MVANCKFACEVYTMWTGKERGEGQRRPRPLQFSKCNRLCNAARTRWRLRSTLLSRRSNAHCSPDYHCPLFVIIIIFSFFFLIFILHITTEWVKKNIFFFFCFFLVIFDSVHILLCYTCNTPIFCVDDIRILSDTLSGIVQMNVSTGT